jgi:hypothetical protein
MTSQRQEWWHWLDDHLDRGAAGQIGAHYLLSGRSAERIRQFCRPPKDLDPDHNSGDYAPPQIYEEFFGAWFLNDPVNALLMHERVKQQVDLIVGVHSKEPVTAAKLSKECHEGLDAVLSEEPVEVQRRVLMRARAAVDAKLRELDECQPTVRGGKTVVESIMRPAAR